jgi:hypothetical protein
MNIELLKKEVLKTICQYIEATQKCNLNWNYISENDIHAGLCCYARCNNLHYLKECISKFNYHNDYIFATPWTFNFVNQKHTFLECHNVRLKYLTKILQEIIFIESEKQKGNIYTYYKLIELFKF